jgi:3-deoxy-D-manno-octulosonate 8-phosphate phosphatase (KDO 8-P phosphatase)
MLETIDLLVLDVDGVLSDGRIIYDSRGAESKVFHVLDGEGVKHWLRAGHEAAILSGRASRIVWRRAEELGVRAVYMNAKDKLPVFERILKRFRRKADRVCYIGDELVDVPVMARAGFAVATPGAADEAKRVAHYVTRRPGGAGAVRETVQLILQYQGLWDGVIARYRDRLPPGLPAARNPWGDRP